MLLRSFSYFKMITVIKKGLVTGLPKSPNFISSQVTQFWGWVPLQALLAHPCPLFDQLFWGFSSKVVLFKSFTHPKLEDERPYRLRKIDQTKDTHLSGLIVTFHFDFCFNSTQVIVRIRLNNLFKMFSNVEKISTHTGGDYNNSGFWL